MSTDLNLENRRNGQQFQAGRQKLKFNPCPEPELDLDMDRREATFALLGQLWATTTGVIASVALLSSPQPSEAVYGADANIAVPNVMEGINNRVNQQCLVESLGNRECLVYLDPEKKIYKGADAQVLVERLEKAIAALAEVPMLVSEKKWSKVTGVITGPMGSLGRTMDQLSKLCEDEAQLKLIGLEKSIKTDLYAIAAAAEKKNGEQILKFHEKATQDLIAYAKALP